MGAVKTNVAKQCRGDGCQERWECERFHSYYMRERKPFENFYCYGKDKNGKCRYRTPSARTTHELVELRVAVRHRHR